MTVKLGMIKGRHEMPVDTYIIDTEITDVLDFETIERLVKEGLSKTLPINDNNVFLLADDVEIYVTGLTSVTIAIVNWINNNLILRHDLPKIYFMHYDMATKVYKAQLYKGGI